MEHNKGPAANQEQMGPVSNPENAYMLKDWQQKKTETELLIGEIRELASSQGRIKDELKIRQSWNAYKNEKNHIDDAMIADLLDDNLSDHSRQELSSRLEELEKVRQEIRTCEAVEQLWSHVDFSNEERIDIYERYTSPYTNLQPEMLTEKQKEWIIYPLVVILGNETNTPTEILDKEKREIPLLLSPYDHLKEYADILKRIDGKMYKGLESKISDYLEGPVNNIKELWEQTPEAKKTINEYEKFMKMYARVISFQIGIPGTGLGSKFLGELEIELWETKGEELPAYAYGKSLGQKNRSTLAGSMRLPSSLLAVHPEIMLAANGLHYLEFTNESEPEYSGKWIISPQSSKEGVLIYLQDQPWKQVVVSYSELSEKLDEEPPNIQALVLQAKEEEQKELAQVDEIIQFELPKQKKITHIRFYPKTFDQGNLIQQTMLSSSIRAHAYQQQHGSLAAIQPILTDNPLEQMEQVLKAKEGEERCYVFEFYTHGSEDALEYEDPVTAKEIVALLRQYPNNHYVINTIACYGGGLIKGFQEETGDDNLNLAVFTQSRGDTVNTAAIVDAPEGTPSTLENQTYGTHYAIDNAVAMYSGLGDGAAFLYADALAQAKGLKNAEALISGNWKEKKE